MHPFWSLKAHCNCTDWRTVFKMLPFSPRRMKSASKWWQFSFKYISHQLSNNEALFTILQTSKDLIWPQMCTYEQRMRAWIDIMKPCHGGGWLGRKTSGRGERERCFRVPGNRAIHQATVTEGWMRHVSDPRSNRERHSMRWIYYWRCKMGF